MIVRHSSDCSCSGYTILFCFRWKGFVGSRSSIIQAHQHCEFDLVQVFFQSKFLKLCVECEMYQLHQHRHSNFKSIIWYYWNLRAVQKRYWTHLSIPGCGLLCKHTGPETNGPCACFKLNRWRRATPVSSCKDFFTLSLLECPVPISQFILMSFMSFCCYIIYGLFFVP